MGFLPRKSAYYPFDKIEPPSPNTPKILLDGREKLRTSKVRGRFSPGRTGLWFTMTAEFAGLICPIILAEKEKTYSNM